MPDLSPITVYGGDAPYARCTAADCEYAPHDFQDGTTLAEVERAAAAHLREVIPAANRQPRPARGGRRG